LAGCGGGGRGLEKKYLTTQFVPASVIERDVLLPAADILEKALTLPV